MALKEVSNPVTPAIEYITKVDVKLPEFWTEEPDLWFIQAEAVFRNAVPWILLSRTKFDHVVQKLPQKILISVRSLIRNSAVSSTPFEELNPSWYPPMP